MRAADYLPVAVREEVTAKTVPRFEAAVRGSCSHFSGENDVFQEQLAMHVTKTLPTLVSFQFGGAAGGALASTSIRTMDDRAKSSVVSRLRGSVVGD